jgi:trigger factor
VRHHAVLRLPFRRAEVSRENHILEEQTVNVSVEHLGPCRKLLRIEVNAAAVDAKFEEVTKEFQRHAQLPGFRPGKVPREMVLRSFGRRIEDEVRRRLIPEAFRDAVRQQRFRVVGEPDLEETQFGRGQPLQFVATVETAPEFELPEYKGLPVRRQVGIVTDADVERALTVLREQQGSFVDVARAVQSGDYVVVNYHATVEGRPLREVAPNAQSLSERHHFWVHVGPDEFLPGFSEQLIGASAGETRAVTVEFPPNFVTPELAGRQATFEVEVVQVKERRLPELDEAFARSYGAPNLEALREGVRADLARELEHKQNVSVRNQLVRQLLDRVHFDLPESFVTQETRNVVYDIVRENQRRGVTSQAIEQAKDQIYTVATNSAKERVKVGFLLSRIAEKEGITATQEEIHLRVALLAQQYQMKPEKVLRQLQQRDGLAEIAEQIITAKVLDFLAKHARVEEVPAGTAA